VELEEGGDEMKVKDVIHLFMGNPFCLFICGTILIINYGIDFSLSLL
jgi:hypothetical protein